MGEQHVFLPLDVSASLTGQPGVFTFADFVECLPQVTQDVELVEENSRLWRMIGLEGRGGEGFPTCPSRPVESACVSWVPATNRTDPCWLPNGPSRQTKSAAAATDR